MSTRAQIEPSTGVKIIYSTKYDYPYMLQHGLASYGDIVLENQTGNGGVLHMYDTDYFFAGYVTYDYDHPDASGKPTVKYSGHKFIETGIVNDGDVSITGAYFGDAINVGKWTASDAKGNQVVLLTVEKDGSTYQMVYSDKVVPSVKDLIVNGHHLTDLIEAAKNEAIDAALGVTNADVIEVIQNLDTKLANIDASIASALLQAKEYADTSIKAYVDSQDASLRKRVDASVNKLDSSIKQLTTQHNKDKKNIDASINELRSSLRGISDEVDTYYGVLADLSTHMDASLDELAAAIEGIKESQGIIEEVSKIKEYVDASVNAAKAYADASVSALRQDVSAGLSDISAFAHGIQEQHATDKTNVDARIEELRALASGEYAYSTTGHTIMDTGKSDISTIKEAIDILIENCYYTLPSPVAATYTVAPERYQKGQSSPIVFTVNVVGYNSSEHTITFSDAGVTPISKGNGIFDVQIQPTLTSGDITLGVKVESSYKDSHNNSPVSFEKTLTSKMYAVEYFELSDNEYDAITGAGTLFETSTLKSLNQSGENAIIGNASAGQYAYVALIGRPSATPVIYTAGAASYIECVALGDITITTQDGEDIVYQLYRAEIPSSGYYYLSYSPSAPGGGGTGEIYWEEI